MKLKEAIDLLRSSGIESAAYDARALFRQIGGISPSDLVLRDADCSSSELTEAIERRKRREPLQYILGEADFYKETYKVTPDCLIPRPDTELLVDYAVKHLPSGASFIDICTGSGCIAVSTLKNTTATTALAVDISEAALNIARHNAERNGVLERVQFIYADALSAPVAESCFALLSNPPYVTDKAYTELEPEIYFEPKIAFVGGEDGLDFYRRLISLYKSRIAPEGFMAFEIGYDQAEALKAIAKEEALACEILKDYSGNDRVAILRHRQPSLL